MGSFAEYAMPIGLGRLHASAVAVTLPALACYPMALLQASSWRTSTLS